MPARSLRLAPFVPFVVLSLMLGCSPRSPRTANGGGTGGGAGTAPNATPVEKSFACPAGMLAVGGGTFEATPYYSNQKKKAVTIVPFCLDATEVTVEAYARCVGAKQCEEPEGTYDPTARPFCNWQHPKGRAKHPINCVEITHARAFCKAAGKRLPFAEEREWAARGGLSAATYPWGNDAPSPTLLNACAGECVPNYAAKTGNSIDPMYLGADAFPETAPVGSFPAGHFGLYDMSGNVAELTVRIDQVSDVEQWGGSFLSGKIEEVAADGRGVVSGATTGFRCALTPELE